MSEISIQVRRVTEKVKQYFSIFGLRPYSRMRPGRSVIKGSKRLGFDEIECVVAETARGTSVGFYAINQLQGLLHTIPFIFVLLLSGLAQIEGISPYLTGTADNFLSINLVEIFIGTSSFSFSLVFILLLIAAVFGLTEYLIQRIRLDILKSRFSFYSRDAIWETREMPLSLVVVQALRSVFMHTWLLAIIYYAIFSSTGTVLSDLSAVYGAQEEALRAATTDAFVITGGLVLGLITSYKAIILRKQHGRVDERLRISGGLTERRFDPIIFGLQSALFAGVVFAIFMSVTFMSGATAAQLGQFLLFVAIGGGIAGSIQAEGDAWIMASYAVFLFFTSLILIFRTGNQSAYAYVVVLQLFFIPIPFIVLLSMNFDKVLKKANIKNKTWLFDTLPITSFISLYLHRRKQEEARRAYEESLEEEISTEVMKDKIKIRKDILQDSSTNAYKMVRHYFELLFTYTASFEDTQFVTLPTFYQLKQWWTSKTGQSFDEDEKEFVEVTDQILWDPSYRPEDNGLNRLESAGREMVLEIQ